MKKITMVMALIIGLSSLMHLSAQKFNKEEMQEQRKEQMVEELGLSETQVAEMEAEREQLHNQMKEIRENENLTREEKREEIGQLMEVHQGNLEKILTEEQLIKLDELRPNRGEMEGRKRNFRAGEFGKDSARFALLLEKRKEFDIQLSDEEKEIIEEHRNEFSTRMQERRMEAGSRAECGERTGKRNRDGDGDGLRSGKRMQRGMMMHVEGMEELLEIVSTHEDEINSILSELRPENTEMNARRNGKRRNNEACIEGEFNGNRAQMRAVRFLLMDPADEPMGMENENILNIYPNPARSVLNIEYDLPEAGDVKIELLDRNGNMIETVDHRFRDSGFHHLTLDINDLEPNEIYFIQLTDQSHNNVIKFIKL